MSTTTDRRRKRMALWLAVVAVVLLVAGATTVIVVREFMCTGLTMYSSDEKAEQLREIAGRYRRSGHKIDDRCVSVTIAVTGSRATADALAGDPATPWPLEPEPPHIWSPSSSVWVQRLRDAIQQKPGRARSVGEDRSLVTTPVVIAMPRPMAEALGWPQAEIGWRDLLALAKDPRGWGAKGHPEWGAFKLGKTNPAESTTGLLATTATATALAGGGTGTLSTEDLPKVAEDLRALERATVHYGRYVETFVDNLYQADKEHRGLEYVSAIAMEEKVLLDYNKGILLSDPRHPVPPPGQKLAAIFPRDGTMVSDNPAVVVDAAWVDDVHRRAAADFLAYVQENRQVFLDAGFRDREGNSGAAHTLDSGTIARPAYRLVRTPPTAVIEGVRSVWQQTRRRANILLVIDVSGSMEAPVSAGKTRLDLARAAAKLLPAQLAADDHMGLWEFSSPVASDANPWRQLVELGPVDRGTQKFAAAIDNLKPIGQTALYRTASEAVRAVAGKFDPSRINAVILLSDGKNEPPDDSGLTELLGQLKETEQDKVVRVFTIAYGEEADAGKLAMISQATRARMYSAKDASTIEGVMLDVLSNF
ncbi:MAG TPA: substrate-binding domain-containing protein [Candidatus Limnocylindrales bacterium]|nr:substrate-binding domain-containing protein [Candidatus Limnocylindrales bacterium]